ncbi:bifunctional homocysteine S-methyltransferase/methylenetetrahydrofolate reductase [bacterium]|nr:bifunctional homocysteine S-methyltransferase/methylenetetrahydrofolate reductase [bacterium]
MTLLEQRMSQKILVGDGAMGTRLQALVGTSQACIDALNLDPTFRDIVALVHRSYLEAGSDVIFTNTYGANAVKLGRYGRASQVRAINSEGVSLARACAQVLPDRLVGGSVGPLEIYSMRDEYSEEQLEEIFHEQMDALVQAGVDFLVLETFQDLLEASVALRVAQRFDRPVLLSVGGVQNGHTGTGADVREFALMASRMKIAMIGANCRGPYDILETLQILARVTALPLFAVPNAGSPEIDRGRVAYNVDSTQFGHYAVRLAQAGAALIGGCCGTEPGHIQQLAQSLKDCPPPPPRTVSEVRIYHREAPRPAPSAPPNVVAEVFRKVPLIVSVELRPGRTTSLHDFLESGRYLAQRGVHLFDVPDNAGAKVTVDPMWSASQLQAETGIPTLIHLSTSHRNLVATQSYLLGCWQAGIQGVLAVTGDHPNVGDHDKYASRVNDVKSSVNLMGLMGMLNQGRLFNETPCFRTNFCVGGGLNPVRGLTAQIKWLHRKIEAGAQFVYTQPVYREEDVDRMLEMTQDVDLPILVGIMPLVSRRNAEFFAAGRIPGVIIPPEVLARFENVEDPGEGRKLGTDMAIDLMDRLRSKVRGFYLLPPFGKDHHLVVGELLAATTRSFTQSG